MEESPYEVKGDIGGGQEGPQRSRTSKTKLLADSHVYFWGPFKQPPLKELNLLATLGGATIVTRDGLRSATEDLVVIYEGSKKGEDDVETFQNKYPHLQNIVSHKWLLDSAGSYTKQSFDGYL